ncbi:MAG: hypothetical protein U1E05_06095 [Patescibacteria group bacterium]|nr:hypothetical protein [Patescibacteria group bacterium]
MTANRWGTLFLLFSGIALLSKGDALGGEAAKPDAERLFNAAATAETQFHPLTEKDVLRARMGLAGAVSRLEGRLAADGENGRAWAAYVKLADLQGLLGQSQLEPDALEAIYRRFGAGNYGLNRSYFTEVRDALLQTIQIIRATQTPELDKAYAKYVATLTEYLRSYVKEPSAEQAVRIGEAIGWLEGIGQAPDLIAAVREELARPNLFVTVSDRLVVAGMEEPVDETAPVRDVILGTSIHGVGRSVGNITATLTPNSSHAVFDITYLGVTTTRNTGYNGPVVIVSEGTTGIGATKRLWVNELGLHGHPTRANATTHSTICDIQAQRGGRMVERIAWRKAMEQKHLAEAIASRHAASRAGRQVDDRAAAMIAEVNHDFEHKFRRPATERNLFPSKLAFSTDEDALRVTWRQAAPAQLAAPTEPPAAMDGADLTVRIHESMINNGSQTALAGLTMNDDEFRMAVVELLGRLPEKLNPVPGEEPWGVSFDRAQPVEVRFVDGGVRVTIRGRRYFQGDQPHPGMNVSANYKIVHDESGFRAVRQGEVEVVPPGLGEEQRVGTRYQIIRTLLIRRFTPIFESEIRFEDIALPDKWSKVGAMSMVQLESNDGWLTIAWKLPEKP